MSNKILSISDITAIINSMHSAEVVLDVIIQQNIPCYIERPLGFMVFAETRSSYDSFHELVDNQNKNDANELFKPKELAKAHLLRLKSYDLLNLAKNHFALPIIFEGILLDDLTVVETMYSFTGRSGIAKNKPDTMNGNLYRYQSEAKISLSDLRVTSNTLEKIISICAGMEPNLEDIKASLRVRSPKVTILNNVTFDLYHNHPPGRKNPYAQTKVKDMIINESVDGVYITPTDAAIFSALINKSPNFNHGPHSNKDKPRKIILTNEMEAFRKQPYFSDQLTLVNYFDSKVNDGNINLEDLKQIALAQGVAPIPAKNLRKLF